MTGEVRTAVMLVGLVVSFVVAEVASRVNPGPDWFDTADFPHVDAVLFGLASGLIAAVATAAVLRWWRR